MVDVNNNPIGQPCPVCRKGALSYIKDDELGGEYAQPYCPTNKCSPKKILAKSHITATQFDRCVDQHTEKQHDDALTQQIKKGVAAEQSDVYQQRRETEALLHRTRQQDRRRQQPEQENNYTTAGPPFDPAAIQWGLGEPTMRQWVTESNEDLAVQVKTIKYRQTKSRDKIRLRITLGCVTEEGLWVNRYYSTNDPGNLANNRAYLADAAVALGRAVQPQDDLNPEKVFKGKKLLAVTGGLVNRDAAPDASKAYTRVHRFKRWVK